MQTKIFNYILRFCNVLLSFGCFSSVWWHPRAILWSYEAVWSGRITSHNTVPVPWGLRWPWLLQYWGKSIRISLSMSVARQTAESRKFLYRFLHLSLHGITLCLCICFDSVFYTSGRWKSSIQRHYFYFVEIMNVDIWQNISPSNKNVSTSQCLSYCFSFFLSLSVLLMSRVAWSTFVRDYN